tara:strand:- start:8 stop:1048 length:1041 start_codon:yes stop_codon:yes gene_type:complete
MSKIKVFLGGYINYKNAQNINCKSIADSLDKEKFEVYTLTAHYGERIKTDFRIFNCFWPFIISSNIGFLWGVLNSDVAYLPKHINTPLWLLRFAKLIKRPVFTTIEGKIQGDKKSHDLVNLFGSNKRMFDHFKYIKYIYGISQHIIDSSINILPLEPKPLFLGVDIHKEEINLSRNLKNIIFIGSLIERKRVHEFILLAQEYNNISFHIVGDGPEKDILNKNISNNVVFHGHMNYDSIKTILLRCQLMFLPSKSEGFPKVILEAASFGVPSMVYNTYGASEWLTHNFNGFIINDFMGAKDTISKILKSNDLLEHVSKNVLDLALEFDWKKRILCWENIINKLYNER